MDYLKKVDTDLMALWKVEDGYTKLDSQVRKEYDVAALKNMTARFEVDQAERVVNNYTTMGLEEKTILLFGQINYKVDKSLRCRDRTALACTQADTLRTSQ